MSWIKDLDKIERFLDKYDKERRFRFKGNLKLRFEKYEDKILSKIVDEAAGPYLNQVNKWIKYFRDKIDSLKSRDSITDILLSRELRSFIIDPKRHLKKKIILYFHDLLRGILSLDEFIEKAYPAIKTSLRTNMRTVYQDWILLTILDYILEKGGYIVYPENNVISLERSKMQKLGWIPPNIVLRIRGWGYISIFIEAPRPVGWGDSVELKNIWKLYTTLRPDIMIYGGRVMNILNLSSEPPVKRPDLIIEVKELDDWYKRVREVRGPLAKPLSIEEWRSMWIEGLWSGLAGILGVKRETRESVKRGRGVRLKDVDIVRLYNRFYNPRDMIVITKAKTPRDIKKILEDEGISVYDNIGFKPDKLINVVETLCEYAYSDDITIRIDGKLYEMIKEAAKSLNVPEEDLVFEILERGLKEFIR